MSDNSKPKPSPLPSWQQTGESDDEDSATNEPSHTEEEPIEATGSNDDLRQQALSFLDHEEIKEAPIERKIEFLKRKGLAGDEIEDLLNQPSRSGRDEKTKSTNLSNDKVGVFSHNPAVEVSALTFILQPSGGSGAEALPKSSKPSSPSAKKALEDATPIITYPEFLIHSQKPPPLITADRLLATFYAASGATALAYGVSKYIVEPMIDSLTTARHSLAQNALTNTGRLNKKLEASVSAMPESLKMESAYTIGATDDQDPSSFFHRSAATQTSPHVSRSNSTSSSQSGQQVSPIDSQATKLSKLQDNLQQVCATENGTDTKKELDSLQTYLMVLTYPSTQRIAGVPSKDDGIAKLKTEIRQTKGVLLSSRNFPSSAAARGWGSTAS